MNKINRFLCPIYLALSLLVIFFIPSVKANFTDQPTYQNYQEAEFLRLLAERINSFLIYPEKAKQENWEGIVKVQFLLKKDGSIEGLKIEEPSGYPLLDEAAFQAVQDASPYPFPFTDYQSLKVALPISFGSIESPTQIPLQPEQTLILEAGLQEYAQILLEKISSFLIYPQEAKEQGLEGTTKVGFGITKEGNIYNAVIKESSGIALLDEAALSAVKNAAPFAFPFTDRQSMELVLPIRFGSIKTMKQTPAPAEEITPLPIQAKDPQEYAQALLEKISSFLIYPQEAKEQGLEGTTRVEFLVKKDGAFENLKIAESSGIAALDEAALAAVKDAAPLPYFLTDKEEIKVILPLRFRKTTQEEIELAKKETLAQEKELSKKEKVKAKPKQEDKDIVAGLKLDNLYAGFLPDELKEFIKTALQNNQPLQIAKKEVDLAKVKIREALRNFFPSLKFQAYRTEGDVHEIDYEEQEIKATLNQPIFYSGGLSNAYKQAKTNLTITERNYDQKMLDTIQKTEVSYHTLITLRMNLERQNEMLQEAEKILKATENQYKKGVIIPMEFSKVDSWYKRLKLTRDSIAQELDLAYLSFQQVLNTDASPAVNLLSLDIKEFDISLETCINSALEYRPEINLAKLWVTYYDYGKKVQEAKGNFTVDLTGSMGYYQGAYVTEPIKSAKNWYLGFKATKPFGPNTATGSLTTEEAQPRFGQASATGTQTMSGEVGILDNLKLLSDSKNADVELSKAVSQLEETKKNITFEIQDAFFKYQKSLLEVKSALSQKDFRKEELKITEVNVFSGMQGYTSLIESMVNLSEAENTYLRALGNYYISLANLRKATGYGLKI